MITALLITTAILLLILAALQDIVARTIPNGLVIALAVVGALLRVLDGSLPAALLAASLIFMLAVVCWRCGWMGGGDAKLFGAVALLVPPGLVPSLIIGITLSGGILALVFLATRQRIARTGSVRPHGLLARAARVEQWRLRRGGPLPYALAIAIGAIIIIMQ